ncbi:MAG: ProQ/FINO family protein [Betaproteobacteria bacterium]
MSPESTATLVEDHAATAAEADSAKALAPEPALPDAASAQRAEDVIDAPPATAAPGAEEAAATALARTELSPAACAARLAEMFPALFGTQGPPKPIKLRIQADIQERAPGLFTRKALSIVLHRHTTSTPYLKALVAAPTRFDLDGQPAGEIAEEHRQAAREEVERRRGLVAARRAAEGQARNPREPREPSAPREPREGIGAPGRRPPRGPQGPHEPRGDREPRGPHEVREPGGRHEARESRSARPARPARPPRPAGPAGSASPAGNRPDRRGPAQGATPRRDARPPRQDAGLDAARDTARPRPQPEAPAHNALPEDPARRERALLLRTYEASPLTKANFCVLKRITEAELDTQLALARQERGPARPRP